MPSMHIRSLTAQEVAQRCIDAQGYCVMAWVPGMKPGDRAPGFGWSPPYCDYPVVVLCKATREEYEAQREMLELPARPMNPELSAYYRMVTD